MTSKKSDRDNDRNLAIQREILSGRKFSIGEAIGREGGSFLKGESPVPKLVQVKAELHRFVDRHMSDSSGALQAILYVWIESDLRVSQHLEKPLIALQEILCELIDNQNLLYEFVKQVDRQWGQMYGERPYFQKPGQSPHPEDEYTHESVHLKLKELLDIVKSQN